MKIELEIKLIVGKISYVDLETGFWALTDEEQQYRIEEIPEELQKEGLEIAAVVLPQEEEVSIFMAGIPVELLEYKIIKS